MMCHHNLIEERRTEIHSVRDKRNTAYRAALDSISSVLSTSPIISYKGNTAIKHEMLSSDFDSDVTTDFSGLEYYLRSELNREGYTDVLITCLPYDERLCSKEEWVNGKYMPLDGGYYKVQVVLFL
jgi:hypothetical protein